MADEARLRRPYREIGKSLATRTVELVRALQLIRDSVGFMRAGQVRYLAPLSGQLRALLTDRSTKNEPLLLGISDALGLPLRVYSMPGIGDPEIPVELKGNLVLRVAGFPITVARQYTAQLETSFPELLDRDILFFKGNRYSARTIIDWFANKAGGAHYATRIPEDFAELLADGSVGAAPLISAMLQLGEATLESGRRLLKSVIDLEVHSIIAVPEQPDANIGAINVLFDGTYERSLMRLTLALNKRLMPVFYARGLQGATIQVEADRLVDWSRPRYLRASLLLDDDLSTVAEIAVDGQRVGRTRLNEPLFVLSDPLDYDSYHNRSVDGGPQQFSFGVGEVIMVGTDIDPASAANLLLYSLQKRADDELQVILYAPGAFAHAAKGTKKLTTSGRVTRVRARDAVGAARQSVAQDEGEPPPQAPAPPQG